MKLALCIPAYNEERVIVPTLGAVIEALEAIPGLSWHIIVVDNASTDGTAVAVTEANFPSVSLLSLPEKGKGRAIRAAAAQAAEADLFGFIDADLSAHPAALSGLLREIERGADVAVGSRLLDPTVVRRGVLRTASSKFFNAVRKRFLNVRVEDSQCGLKVMNRRGASLLEECEENTWFLDIELLARADRAGLAVVEVPIPWEEERYEGRTSKLSLVRGGAGTLQAFWRIKKRLSNLYG